MAHENGRLAEPAEHSGHGSTRISTDLLVRSGCPPMPVGWIESRQRRMMQPSRRARLLIQPAGISGGKLPSVHPCPKILALQRAIFETAAIGLHESLP
jgi:hypothetical protein